VVALLSAIAGALLVEVFRGGPAAEAQTFPSQGGGNLLVVTGQVGADAYGVYLVDQENHRMAVYQWLPGKPGKLKLVAARNCAFDLRLDEYNTEPSPNEIEQLVREGQGVGGSSRR